MMLIIACSFLVAAIVAFAYLVGHSVGYGRGVTEGRRQVAEEQYEFKMATLARQQEWSEQAHE